MLPVTNVVDTPQLTRRRIVIGTAALATAGTGLALGTDRAGAQADVDMGDLEIQQSELSPADGEVFSPWVLLSGSWSYRTQVDPAKWETYLLVEDGGGNSEAVGINSGDVTAREATGEYTLRGPITAASFWGPSDFAVPDGQDSITVDVPVQVAFVVRDADDSMLVQARVSDTAVITVTPGGTVASLSGSGRVVAQDDESDPTPTPLGGA